MITLSVNGSVSVPKEVKGGTFCKETNLLSRSQIRIASQRASTLRLRTDTIIHVAVNLDFFFPLSFLFTLRNTETFPGFTLFITVRFFICYSLCLLFSSFKPFKKINK